MELADQFLRGAPFDLLTFILFIPLGVLTLLFSMILASRFAGGIDFGPAHIVGLKGAGLLAVVAALNLLDWGILLSGPVWLFGLMGLYRLEYREARLLTTINWGMNLVWKVLLVALRL
jgi:hypothetical protein